MNGPSQGYNAGPDMSSEPSLQRKVQRIQESVMELKHRLSDVRTVVSGPQLQSDKAMNALSEPRNDLHALLDFIMNDVREAGDTLIALEQEIRG